MKTKSRHSVTPRSKSKKPETKELPASKDLSLRLVAEEINIDNGSHVSVIAFPYEGEERTIKVDRRKLAEHGTLQQLILDQGGPIIPNLKDQCRALAEFPATTRTQTTVHGGWHENIFATIHGSFSSKNAEIDLFFDERDRSFSGRKVRGNLDDYLDGLRIPLQSSRYLTFILCAALLPSFASRIGLKGGFSISFSQTSSVGKTVALRVAQSAITAADETDLTSLNMTDNRAVQVLVPYGGLAIPFKDLKSAPAKSRQLVDLVQTIVFSANDGSQRSTMLSGRTSNPSFCIPMFSAERPIADIFEETGKPFELGEAVRLIDVPVPPGSEGGTFDLLPAELIHTSSELSAEVQRVISENYGLLIPAWIEKFAGIRDVANMAMKFEKQVTDFITKLGSLSPELTRLARPFAMIAVVGRQAIHSGLLPVENNFLQEVITSLFRRTAERVLKGNTELRDRSSATLEWLRDPKSFPPAEIGKAVKEPQKYRDGFLRTSNGQETLYVRREALQKRIANDAFLNSLLLPKLFERKILLRKNSSTIKQKGIAGKLRYYLIDRSLIHRLDLDTIFR